VELFKTEHMFFHAGYIELFQQAILSTDEDKRQEPLEKLLNMHTTDFVNVFRAMDGQGVVKIRLLNRGFSVFLPDPQYAHTEHYQKDVQAIAERCGLSYEECHERILTTRR
jgi:phosphoenolpyruvate synthase/pyruvate phosphate dikinase